MGINKIPSDRDIEILSSWWAGMQQKDIAMEQKISKTRVRQILIKYRMKLPKNKRL